MVTTVSTADGLTHFFDVAGGKAMAFVPKGMVDLEAATVLVYFHGYNSTSDLQSYMKSTPATRDLRPLVAPKTVLFIMPWGGQQSDFSKFVTASGLTTLIDGAIGAAAGAGSKPVPKRLILIGHSGGGMQLPAAAESSFAYAEQLIEVWALDCMYLGEGWRWIAWCRKNPGKRLRVRASTHPLSAKPRAQAEAIAKGGAGGVLANADVDVVNLAHDSFPPTYVPEFVPRLHFPNLHHAAMIEVQRANR